MNKKIWLYNIIKTIEKYNKIRLENYIMREN